MRVKSKKNKQELDTAIRQFNSLGVDLIRTSGDNYIGNCLLCDKEGHFFVNSSNGLWDCKVCGESGNFHILPTVLNTTLHDLN